MRYPGTPPAPGRGLPRMEGERLVVALLLGVVVLLTAAGFATGFALGHQVARMGRAEREREIALDFATAGRARPFEIPTHDTIGAGIFQAGYVLGWKHGMQGMRPRDYTARRP